MRSFAFLALLALPVLSSCKQVPEIPPVEPKAQTRYELASHRCAGKSATCQCRSLTDSTDNTETNPIPDGTRRMELRLSSLDAAVLLSISGLPYEFRPNGETPQFFCWYVDVPTGDKEVSLRARAFDGIPVHAKLALSEYRPDSKEWIPLFALSCGGTSSACDPDTLAAEKDRAMKINERCARSSVKSMTWTGGTEEGVYLDLDVKFLLSVKPLLEKEDPRCTGFQP